LAGTLERQEIGFHQDEVNPYLREYWQELHAARDGTVFVPLCGKSRDMLWLREQGHPVLGVELSAIAVQAFFGENGLIPDHAARGKFYSGEADNIRILCGDFFDLCKDDMANVSAVYDRASLVALPPENARALCTPPRQPPAVRHANPAHHLRLSAGRNARPAVAVSVGEVEALYRDAPKFACSRNSTCCNKTRASSSAG